MSKDIAPQSSDYSKPKLSMQKNKRLKDKNHQNSKFKEKVRKYLAEPLEVIPNFDD